MTEALGFRLATFLNRLATFGLFGLIGYFAIKGIGTIAAANFELHSEALAPLTQFFRDKISGEYADRARAFALACIGLAWSQSKRDTKKLNRILEGKEPRRRR